MTLIMISGKLIIENDTEDKVCQLSREICVKTTRTERQVVNLSPPLPLPSLIYFYFLSILAFINADINECEGKNCSDNGFCQDGINNYTCTCDAGYTGKDCEISKHLEQAITNRCKIVTLSNFSNLFCVK